MHFCRLATTAGYVCGILFSLRLWFGVGRSIPRIPSIVAISPFAEFPLSILLLAALIISLFSSRSRYLVAAAVLTALLVLLDLTRLQPWVYQYVLILITLAFARFGPIERIVTTNQIIVASLYFWSGVQKLNWTFAHEVFPGLLEEANIHLSSSLSGLAILVALIEALSGIGLLVRRTRQVAVVLIVVLHLSVLVLLIVKGLNTVVWPWNVAMLAIVPILFWKAKDSVARKELWRWRRFNVLLHAMFTLCLIAPALSFAGWWPIYLSGALYSGRSPVAVVRINDQFGSQLSDVAKQQIFLNSQRQPMLPLHEWSQTELNVPPYPELRSFRQLTRTVCDMTNNSEDIELIIKNRPRTTDGASTVTRENCQTLK